MLILLTSLLLSSLLRLHSQQASIPATSSYNRYFTANLVHAVGDNSTGAPIYRSHYYNYSFVSTIAPPDHVYFCTQNIDARIFDSPYPNDHSQVNLEYSVDLFSKTDTTITVKIRGYFEKPLFYSLSLRYLLVSSSNPFLSDYMVIQYINLKKGDKEQNINLPSKYAPGHTLNFSLLLKNAKAQFSYTDLNNDGNKFYIQWDYQLYSTSITFSLVVPAYFQNGYYEIIYLAILIDYTMLNQDYPKYRFETVSYSVLRKKQQTYPLTYSLSTPQDNYFFGLSQVQFTLKMHANFQFILLPDTMMGLLPKYLGHNDSYTNFTYDQTIFIYFDCPNYNYRLYNRTDNRCYDDCKSLFYFNVSNQSCLPCRFDCLTCNSPDQCLTCNTTYRYFSNYSCLPLAGTYESNTQIPANCSSSCQACFNSPTNCTACATNKTLFLSNNTCLPCNTLFDGCSVCTESYCISCLTNYTLVNATYCSLPCNDSNCAVCSNTDTTICNLCKDTNYSISIDHKCVGLCGDGKIMNEQCDDGNYANHDGCDSNCLVESDYECYNKTSAQGFTYTQYCAYQRSIDFQIVSVEKLPRSSELSLLISVKQYQESFWRTSSALSYCFVETPVPYRNMRIQLQSTSRNLQQQSAQAKLAPVLASQYPTQSLFLITFEYLSSMQGRNVSLSFDFRNATDLALVEIPANQVNFTVQSGNSHYAHYYSSSTYQRQQLLERLFTLLAAVALLMYLASLILGGKRIAAEQIMVLQLCYLSLLTLPAFTPLQYSVTALRIATNGVNILYDSALPPFNDVLSDSTAKGAQMYSQFLYNFNLGILVILLPLLVGFGAFLASKLGRFSEAGTKRVERIYRLAVGEYTFTGLIFAGSIIGAAAVLEVRFGFQEISSTIGLASLYVPAILLVLYPVYLALRLCQPNIFQEYSNILKQGKPSVAFQLVFYSLGILCGAGLAGLSSSQYINCLVAASFLTLFGFNVFIQLFKKQFDHYHTQLNLLTLVLAQVPFIYSHFNPSYEYTEESDLIFLLPLLLAVLMSLNVFGNLGFFVHLVVKRIKEGMLVKEAVEEKEAAKLQNFDHLYTSSLINPLQYAHNPKFINSFIDQSEKEEEEMLHISKKNFRGWKGGSILRPESETAKVIVLQQDYIHNQFNDINEL